MPPRLIELGMQRGMHLYWRFARGMTLGVRALLIDGTGRVFLVKHSYIAGWHLPGGGVEPGETLMTALTRELREEGNIELGEQPALFGIYFNRRISRRDHVALYVVRSFHQSAPSSRTERLLNTASSRRGRFPKTQRAEHARASGNFSMAGHPPSCGDCAAQQS